MEKTIKNALISVFHKEGLEPILDKLVKQGVKLFSTGGTQKFIQELGYEVHAVEGLTGYPSVFGGRVKTLHPKVFGGILYRRELEHDVLEAEKFEIPPIDLVVVDLYPFEKTLQETNDESKIIEKIDIGGISLIRAAAKNYKDVLVVSESQQYPELLSILERGNHTDASERKQFAQRAFNLSSHYDTCINNYFLGAEVAQDFKQSIRNGKPLRYGENPHQAGTFFGPLEDCLEQLGGKDLSYNNLVDIDAAIMLIQEFEKSTFAILKHTNVCGCASNENLKDAYLSALAGDNVSAFGGILITNRKIDLECAEEINQLFYEVLIAPDFDDAAKDLLLAKKKRIVLKWKETSFEKVQFKSLLNGVIQQEKDLAMETRTNFKTSTIKAPSERELTDLEFALKLVKHLKSNTIVLAKADQLIGMGCGQTSRVDALKQAIAKAKAFGFDTSGAVMASDAFFPFPDCVEIAHSAGIAAVVQPGGSIRDKDSIEFCDKNDLSMVLTGIRHFKH